jgi:hypothetical protein
MKISLVGGLTVRSATMSETGLDQALAAARPGDTLVVPKIDRLARSVPDACAIGDSLTERGIKLSLGGQVYDVAWVPYFPLGSAFPGVPKVTELPAEVAAATALGATPAQVGLAWLTPQTCW